MIDGLPVHFIHLRSPHPEALPLIITHGWPGSVVEFLKVIGPLSDPSGDGGDAFHVVCPSLPGYGFSGKPDQTGWGIERIAGAWASLMARLGYRRYGAVGSDWGTSVSTLVGRLDPEHVAGIHLIPPLAGPDPGTFDDLTDAERSALASLEHSAEWDSGYSREHATRPQTIGYALVDSPVALAAWIVEKFWSWTDRSGPLGSVLTRDELLDNLMLYWLPRTGASSARLYWESIRQVNEWIAGCASRYRRRADRLLGVCRRTPASVAALGGEAVHRHPVLERAGTRRSLRRVRAAGTVRRGSPGVLPAGPLVVFASRG